LTIIDSRAIFSIHRGSLMGEDNTSLILTELRQLRTDYRADIASLKNEIINAQKPSNAELAILVENITNDVATLTEDVADLKKFRNYSWGIISFLVVVSSLIGKNIMSILRWLKIL